ncbi:hypothetical protein, partial [Xanthomonas citri]|uniref:hypothetical protein n=1 Tax=Xanthomonas citri TaxID=346 RepID=UPI001C1FACAC
VGGQGPVKLVGVHGASGYMRDPLTESPVSSFVVLSQRLSAVTTKRFAVAINRHVQRSVRRSEPAFS